MRTEVKILQHYGLDAKSFFFMETLKTKYKVQKYF